MRAIVTWVEQIPMPLQWGLGGVLALLILGSIAALILPALQPGKWADLGPRMKSWWIICVLVAGALLAGWQAFTILMMLISFLALKEYLTLAPTRKEDRIVVLLAYAAILINYGTIFADKIIWEDSYRVYLVIVPVYMFLAAAALMAWIGRTEGYLATVGIVHWGVVVCVYNIGYAAFLMRTPNDEAPAGAAGLVFFLLFITQLNDVLQYCWGKAIGRTKITPRVSPNKTWEGAIGGWLTTAVVFYFLAPYFTPLKPMQAVVCGLIVPAVGFFGDITMSAIKRDLGVKDTSHLIPGHGGVLDRIDSLTFTTPVYFHLLAIYSLARF